LCKIADISLYQLSLDIFDKAQQLVLYRMCTEWLLPDVLQAEIGVNTQMCLGSFGKQAFCDKVFV